MLTTLFIEKLCTAQNTMSYENMNNVSHQSITEKYVFEFCSSHQDMYFLNCTQFIGEVNNLYLIDHFVLIWLTKFEEK